jgi:hypothetical protein
LSIQQQQPTNLVSGAEVPDTLLAILQTMFKKIIFFLVIGKRQNQLEHLSLAIFSVQQTLVEVDVGLSRHW